MAWDPAKQIPEWLSQVGKGWHPLLTKLHEDLMNVHPEYGVLQVKEKFGGLRAYLHTTAAGQELAREAERKSYTICEHCGKPGSLAKIGGWYSTMCDTCLGEAKTKYPLRPVTRVTVT